MHALAWLRRALIMARWQIVMKGGDEGRTKGGSSKGVGGGC